MRKGKSHGTIIRVKAGRCNICWPGQGLRAKARRCDGMGDAAFGIGLQKPEPWRPSLGICPQE